MSVQASSNNACCTINLCGGQQKGSYRDLMMGVLEIAGAAYSLYSFIYQQNYSTGGGTAAATVLTAIVHWRWRTDAHGDKSTGEKELKEVQVEEAEKEDKGTKGEHRLSTHEKDLIQVGQLALLNLSYQETSRELEAKIKMFEEAKKELKDENRGLLESNQELKTRIRALSTVIKEISGIHGQYKKHNGELEAIVGSETSRLQGGEKTDRTETAEEDGVETLPTKQTHAKKHAHAEKPAHDKKLAHAKKLVIEEDEDTTEHI